MTEPIQTDPLLPNREPDTFSKSELLKSQYKQKYCNDEGPYVKSYWFSKLFFCWINPIISISKKVTFEQDMYYKIPEYDKIENLLKKFERNWDQVVHEQHERIQKSEYEIQKPQIIYSVLWRTFKCHMIFQIVGGAIRTALSYGNS